MVQIYDLSTLWWCERDAHSVETGHYVLMFVFSWVSDMWHDPILWCYGSHSPSQLWNHKGEQLLLLQPFCTLTTILFFASVLQGRANSDSMLGLLLQPLLPIVVVHWKCFYIVAASGNHSLCLNIKLKVPLFRTLSTCGYIPSSRLAILGDSCKINRLLLCFLTSHHLVL